MAILEMDLKTLILSTHDNLMSKSWNRFPDTLLKLLTNLVSWKLAQLISQSRTGIQQQNFRLKGCSQGVLQGFLPLPSKSVWLKNDHLIDKFKKLILHKIQVFWEGLKNLLQSFSKFGHLLVTSKPWVYFLWPSQNISIFIIKLSRICITFFFLHGHLKMATLGLKSVEYLFTFVCLYFDELQRL